MAWTEPQPQIEPQVTLRTVPLPLLLPALTLLTTSTINLEEELNRQLGSNVLARVIPSPRISGQSDKEPCLEDLQARESLDEQLTRQLSLLPVTRELSRKNIALLLECLDTRGYLIEETEAIVAKQIGLASRDFAPLLRDIQDWIEPAGLFARNLLECLLIQLRRKKLQGGDAWQVLTKGENHLNEGNFNALRHSLGWSDKRLKKALDQIRCLDPRPGNYLDQSRTVIPEISFEIGPEQSSLYVKLLHENLPRFALESDLLGYVDQRPFQEEWHRARKVMSALALRLRTKMRAARLLAERQKDFLLGTTPAPAPLILKDLAIPMKHHPSTVHRALGTTWAQSPRGTLCLCDLLSRPLKARPDLSVALLRKMIVRASSEGKKDRELSEELGVPRRTIAWHRKTAGL